ncbi:MAG: ThuA domain-containing protein [Pseudomonadaceae bacterium]|nr:ThuA domain-containing protein [Pseudomonadaceae bacterium]
MAALEVLVVCKGHAFAHDAFQEMLASLDGVNTCLVEHPAAQVVLAAADADRWDAVLFYDMCGIPGIGAVHDLADEQGAPTSQYSQAIEGLLSRGTGIVMLNHGTVQWPFWPLWRQISGSSFQLTDTMVDGELVPGSGYRGAHGPLPNATVALSAQGEHPTLDGLQAGFTVTDELYLKTAGFEASVLPLLRADYDFVQGNFSPPPLAPADQQANWTHPKGSDLVAWANAAGRSAVVATDIGDGPSTYGSASFRRFLANSLAWVASQDGRKWALDWLASRG